MIQFRPQTDPARRFRTRLVRVSTVLVCLAAMGSALGCGRSPIGPTPPPPVVTPTPPPPPPPPPGPVPRLSQLRFLAFGDSLTYGVVHLTAANLSLDAGLPVSYPFKLQALLTERYKDQQPVVINGGLPGERASEGRSRLRSLINEADADVVLLMEGANDLNQLGENGLGPTNEAMKELVRTIKGAGAIPMLLMQPPQRPGMPKTPAADLIPDYNKDLRRLADAEGVTVIDIDRQFDVSLQGPDGLHPSEAGYARIAEIVFAAIKARFEQPVATANQPR